MVQDPRLFARHLNIGLPILLLCVLGSFGLRAFTSVRYDFRRNGAIENDDDLKKIMKPKGSVTLESQFEEIKKLDIQNWSNNYEWGKRGTESAVAKFAKVNSGMAIEDDKPYAELWMGTHPNGPSILKDGNVPLGDRVDERPSELGDKVVEAFGKQLPFLFKVLSVGKALSIQVHPSKAEAEKLFQTSPHTYKDGNHKPELAIALTQFEALCGFRPLEEIKFYLRNVPEFEALVEKAAIEDFVGCNDDVECNASRMRHCFRSFMMCDTSVVKSAVDSLTARLGESSKALQEEFHFDLVTKLNKEFPGDVGIFCIYWLNYLVLKPGESIFLAANEPHAYLSGDCIECMANSDNVVRAGLTPKFRDVPVLCQMLSYKTRAASDVIFKPITEDKYSLLFCPPVKDFAVAKVVIPADGEDYTLRVRQSASILIIVDGTGHLKSGQSLLPGSVYYLPSNCEFRVISNTVVTIFQAFCNV